MLLAGLVASSEGRGGTGGGVAVGWTPAGCAFAGCLAMTGGSFANTSLRMARKSSIVDFCI